MKRLALASSLALALVVALVAATTVYVSGGGKQDAKVYHVNRQCMALRNSSAVYAVTEDNALLHGLRICRICGRSKSTKATRNSWLKGTK